jgi:hypothetical protein
MDVIGRDQWDAGVGGELRQHRQAAVVISAIELRCSEIEALLEVISQGEKGCGKLLVRLLRRQRHDDLSRAVREQVGEPEPALALRRPPPSDRQQPRQPAVGGPVGGETQHPEAWPGFDPLPRRERVRAGASG